MSHGHCSNRANILARANIFDSSQRPWNPGRVDLKKMMSVLESEMRYLINKISLCKINLKIN